MQDQIVAEVRKAREAYAAKFQYDLKAMGADLQRKQRERGVRVVTFCPRLVRKVVELPQPLPIVSDPASRR